MSGEKTIVKSEKLETLSSERGIALITVLIFSAIALAVMAALIYMLMNRAEMSGMQKRYRTTLEAGLGGADLTYQIIAARGDDSSISSTTSFSPLSGTSFTVTSSCGLSTAAGCSVWGSFTGLATKMNVPTACWNSSCDYSTRIDPSDSSTYDIAFEIEGTNAYYNVYSKIVDTVVGNSGAGEDLSVKGVVDPRQATKTPVPYMYTIEVDAQNAKNSNERSKLSILYQY